jgi:anthranilate 1,2-dioxygenase small subunit
MLGPADRSEAAALLWRYGALLDEDRLEDWADLFVEDCLYRILTRENEAQSLPLPLVLCDSKDMLRDRIQSLRQANIYNIHTDRHVIGLPHVEGLGEDLLGLSASYALYQTDQEGVTRLFSVGRYEDRMVRRDGAWLFKEKTVIVDTSGILTLLATPI